MTTAKAAGCGAKMAPEFLEQILAALPPDQDPEGRLLCGAAGNEDAAVLRIPPGKALVQTVDILSPIGNDPYLFGQIAAANALSDIYAMGGDPWCAMNIVLYPSTPKAAAEGLDMGVLADILRGGVDKLYEAGGVLAGGHTLRDDEPKYGLSVTGLIDPDHFARNGGARPGDRLLLTKPLGTGILSTAAKVGWDGWEEAEAEFCRWAVRLNRGAGRVIREMRLKGATDITGFGLGGHALEMARASGATIALYADKVPLMGRVLEYAAEGLLPSGSHANKRYCSLSVQVDPGVAPLLEAVMFDAQTSGGLLLAVPGANADRAAGLLAGYGESCWPVGEVLPARRDGVSLEIRLAG
jgi:selenide,water dikinase